MKLSDTMRLKSARSSREDEDVNCPMLARRIADLAASLKRTNQPPRYKL